MSTMKICRWNYFEVLPTLLVDVKLAENQAASNGLTVTCHKRGTAMARHDSSSVKAARWWTQDLKQELYRESLYLN